MFRIRIPALDKSVKELSGMSYAQTAYEVMKLYLTDFTKEELMDCIARSAMSTPASAAISTVLTPLPVVSCVCRCRGICSSAFSVSNSCLPRKASKAPPYLSARRYGSPLPPVPSPCAHNNPAYISFSFGSRMSPV